ncbi:MAG: sterol desaturase family protein [Burkholderiales bacterium]
MLMTILVNTLVVIAAVVVMELVANLTHRYVMHGIGWGWHRSHHEPSSGRWEKNDLYALVFAGISILLFWLDAYRYGVLWWVAVGMTLYGVLYSVFHDGLVHRRYPVCLPVRWRYLERLTEAHRIHHASRERDGAVSFGFLYAARPDRLALELRTRRLAKRGRQ